MTVDLGMPRLPRYEGYQPEHLSYSTLDGFRTCGKRFELQKVLKVEQRPGLAALGGNAVHTATEWYDLHMEGFREETWTDVEQEFRSAWEQEVEKRREQSPSYTVDDYVKTGRASAQYGGKRNVDWWMDNGPGMVQKWIDWRESSGWALWHTPDGEYPAVEVQITVPLTNGTPFLMYLDRVMVTPAGQIVVVDIKTGRVPETGEQLGLYAYGMSLTYGEMFRPDWGYYWTPDKGQGPPVNLDMYTPEHFVDLTEATIRGIEAGVFIAKPQNNCFNWCGVAHACPANPNRTV